MATTVGTQAQRDELELVALAERTGLIDVVAAGRARAAVVAGGGAISALAEAGLDARAARALRDRLRSAVAGAGERAPTMSGDQAIGAGTAVTRAIRSSEVRVDVGGAHDVDADQAVHAAHASAAAEAASDGDAVADAAADAAAHRADAARRHAVVAEAAPSVREVGDAPGRGAIGRRTRIDGWQVLGTLGIGGTAVVLRAVDDRGRRAALKVLSPSVAADPAAADRLLREARALAAVAHPNLVGILGSGRVDGRLWLALELMDGGDAAQLMANGPIAVGDALRIVRDAACGAQALHAVGLIHRDIKPSNIFLTVDGVAKLADLGLAKGDAPDDQLTRPGLRVGTPAYMAREQVRCDPLDARTDVYALGATLFHLVTGRKPYAGAVGDMLRAILYALAPPDPLIARADLPPPVVAILRRAMQPDPARRYRDCAALIADLDAALGGRALPSASRRRRLIGALGGACRRLARCRPRWLSGLAMAAPARDAGRRAPARC